jgi:hypothetical protein
MSKDFIRNAPNRAERAPRPGTRKYRARIAEVNQQARRNAVKNLDEFESALAKRYAKRPRRAGAPSPLRPVAPPARAKKLLLLILTREERATNIIGDLTEEYAEIEAEYGIQFANFWYWKQVAASACPLLKKALRWGFLASIWGWIHRLI